MSIVEWILLNTSSSISGVYSNGHIGIQSILCTLYVCNRNICWKLFWINFFRDKLGKKVEYSQFPSPSSLPYKINIATNNTRFVWKHWSSVHKCNNTNFLYKKMFFWQYCTYINTSILLLRIRQKQIHCKRNSFELLNFKARIRPAFRNTWF